MSIKTIPYGFIPTQITGCSLWLDAADSSSSSMTLSGSTITAWKDKSKSNNTTSYSGTPSISGSAINGKQGIYFNGSSYFTGAISGANTTTITVFIIGSLISPFTSFSGLLCFGNSSQLDYDNVGSLAITMYNAESALYAARNSSSQKTPISAGVPFIYVLQYDGTYINTWLNGTQQTDPSTNIASSGTFTYTNFSIANRAGTTGNYPWSGYFGEIVVYQSALTTPQRQQVESYLAQKWGITLGTGHPGLTTTVYKSTYIKDKGIKMNTGTNIPFYTAFSPKQISGCSLWLDGVDPAGTGVIPTNGATVSTWVDKSGKGYNATGGVSPTYNSSENAITFNGSSWLSTSYSSVPANETAFIVFKTTSTAIQNNCFMIGPSTSGGRLILSVNENDGFGLSFKIGAYAIANGSRLAHTQNQKYLGTTTVASTTSYVYLNGTQGSSSTLTYSGSGTTQIGTAISGSAIYIGNIYEIVIYNTSLSDAQRQQVESYLAQKWGLTSYLPSGHLQFTQPAGARTSLSLANSKLKITSRSTPFLPTSVGGLNGIQLWMDASDSSSASMTLSGSTVTVWKDKSGCGNNTTGYSNTPTLTSSAINGKSAISMGGGYFTGPFATANTGSQIHAFAVLTIDSSGTGAWPRPLSLGRPGANDYSDSTTTFAIIRYSGTQAVGIGRNGQYLSASFPSYSSPFLVQSSHNGSTEYMSVNGNLTVSSSATGQSGNFNITSYGLGVNTNTGDYFIWNGYYGEVIYYNTQLSDTDRQKVEGYLAWKWGIQATLPGGHPYASAAP
jgi:hypothetical protein